MKAMKEKGENMRIDNAKMDKTKGFNKVKFKFKFI